MGGPLDPILRHGWQLVVGAALDHAPRAGQLTVVQPRVLHLACQNLAGRDHANIGTAGQPADIGIVVGGFGAVGKITQIPPKNSDLILDRTAGPSVDHLSEFHHRSLVQRIRKVIRVGVADRNEGYPVDAV